MAKTITTSRITNSTNEFENLHVKQVLELIQKTENVDQKVKLSVKYLAQLGDSCNGNVGEYLNKTEAILLNITKDLSKQQSYESISKLWIMFFGIAQKDIEKFNNQDQA